MRLDERPVKLRTTIGDTVDQMLPRLQSRGADIDVIGYSYYPQYHPGGIAGVQQNLNNTAAAYGKPVVIAETGFPARNPQFDEQNLGFPVTQQVNPCVKSSPSIDCSAYRSARLWEFP